MSLHWDVIAFFVLSWLDCEMVALRSRIMMRVSIVDILEVEGALVFDELLLSP